MTRIPRARCVVRSIGLASAALLLSCSGPEHVEVPVAATPLPCVVFVVFPAEIALERDGKRIDVSAIDDAANPLSIDRRRIAELVTRAGVAPRLATRVVTILAERSEALERARREGGDLIIEVTELDPASFGPTGRNGWFVPNTLLWFILGFPSLWVADRIYGVTWDVELTIRDGATGERLLVVRESLREERELSVLDRGWAVSTLWTPPAFYDGTRTGRALAPIAEEWIAARIIAWLESEARSPRLSRDVEIDISEPLNGSTIASRSFRLVAEVRSRRPLEGLRVDVNEVRQIFRTPLDMPSSRIEREAGGLWHIVRIAVELDGVPGTNTVRVFARSRADSAPVLSGNPVVWSATRTLELEIEEDADSPDEAGERTVVADIR
jgi:hypothetical protein